MGSEKRNVNTAKREAKPRSAAWRAKIALIFIALACAAFFAYSAWDVYNFGKHVADVEVDAAIIIVDPDEQAAMGENLEKRIDQAYEQWDMRNINAILVCGSQDAADVTGYALKSGFDRDSVIVVQPDSSLAKMFESAKTAGGERGFKRYLIICEPMMMKRAMRSAESAGLEAYPFAAPPAVSQGFLLRARLLAQETAKGLLGE